MTPEDQHLPNKHMFSCAKYLGFGSCSADTSNVVANGLGVENSPCIRAASRRTESPSAVRLTVCGARGDKAGPRSGAQRRMLRYGMPFVDKGARYYEETHRQRQIRVLKRKAAQLGLQLIEVPTPEL